MPMLHRVQAQLGRLWSSCASTRSMQTQQQHNNSVNNNHSDEEMGEEEFIENVEERSVWLHTDTHLRVDDDASFSSNMLLHVLYVASFYATTLHFMQTNIGKHFEWHQNLKYPVKTKIQRGLFVLYYDFVLLSLKKIWMLFIIEIYYVKVPIFTSFSVLLYLNA